MSVAAKGFEAPGVVVSYTDNDKLQSGSLFTENGIQIAAGVPLMAVNLKASRLLESVFLVLISSIMWIVVLTS